MVIPRWRGGPWHVVTMTLYRVRPGDWSVKPGQGERALGIDAGWAGAGLGALRTARARPRRRAIEPED
jgi:hypothetical protein